MSEVRLSVVVPTYNRREILARTIPRLLAQDAPEGAWEIVVVVDGSRDGTLEMLSAQASPRLRVVSQENRGLAAARNRGAREAAGGAVLFLDDDMEAPAELARLHLEAHADGQEKVVFGRLALAGAGRQSFLKAGVHRWGEDLARKLSRAAAFRFDDCHFGHASLTRHLLLRAGGFDETFVRFGNEDYELGWRLIRMGARMEFRTDAVAAQIYDKDLRRWLSDCRCVGRADLVLAGKHPELAAQLRFSHPEGHPLKRLAAWSGSRSRDPLAPAWAAAEAILDRLERLRLDSSALTRAQSLLGTRAYWEGVRVGRAESAGPRAAGASSNGRAA